MENNHQPLPTPLPGEVVQQIVYDLISKSGLTYSEAIRVLAFVLARLLHASTETPEVAERVINKIPEGILIAYQRIRLYDHEPNPGQKPN